MAAILAASRCFQRIPGGAGAVAADDLLAGDEQIKAEVVGSLGQLLVQHLSGWTVVAIWAASRGVVGMRALS
jgi:hypothetical protein